jgi:hypothetical protein
MAGLTDAIISWVGLLGWDVTQETGYPVYEGAYIREEPDRIVFVTGAGGPGYVTEEGSADAAQFQFRVRGPADSSGETEAAAHLLDSMVLTALFPAQVNGINIQHVHRLGGRPTPLPVNPQDLRHEFTCNYIAIVG